MPRVAETGVSLLDDASALDAALPLACRSLTLLDQLLEPVEVSAHRRGVDVWTNDVVRMPRFRVRSAERIGGDNRMIWLLVLLLVVLAIGGGVALSKFLFALLVVALVLARLGAFNGRSPA